MDLKTQEREKYADIWSLPDYGKQSPGQYWTDLFVDIATPKAGQSLVDLGCGQGAAGLSLEARFRLQVAYLDLVNLGGLEPFIEQALWEPLPPLNPWGDSRYDYGYCCDVLEHIPEAFTMLSVKNALNACDRVFFSISFMPDHFGKFVEEPITIRSSRSRGGVTTSNRSGDSLMRGTC